MPKTRDCIWGYRQINESCKTVTGFIEYIKKEPDEDDRIRLKLDPEYLNLTNQKNIDANQFVKILLLKKMRNNFDDVWSVVNR